MPNKRATGSRSTVIRCPNCGEDYSVTYKRCPFCEEKASAKKRERYEDDGGDFEIEYEGEHRPFAALHSDSEAMDVPIPSGRP